jgi:predicted metal-dependent phosphoesterase TrpH
VPVRGGRKQEIGGFRLQEGKVNKMASFGSGHPGGPYFTIDLHLHTSRGSSDSNVSPQQAIERAREIGISAICITEHDHIWDVQEVRDYAAQAGVVLLRGMEVTTEVGHVGAFGLDRYVGGIYRLKELRRVADDCGGLLIANHPFRYRLDPKLTFFNNHDEPFDAKDVGKAAEAAVFSLVDAVEVLNGCCSEEENRFALQVARALNLAEVAGSDSHSVDSIGCVCTVLEAPAATERDLIEAIKASQCRAGRGLLHEGTVTLFNTSG